MLMAFFVPMLLHGIFDGLLMVADVSELLQGVCLDFQRVGCRNKGVLFHVAETELVVAIEPY